MDLLPPAQALPRGFKISALSGFLVSGFIFSLIGALLPAWGYDVSSDYAVAGRHFLAMVLGIIVSGAIVRKLRLLRTRVWLVAGCSLCAFSLAILAGLPNQLPWRICGLFTLGISCGILHAGLFEAVLPAYQRNPALAVSLGGVFFGAGSVIGALLVSGVFWTYSVQAILLLLAAIPAGFAILYTQRTYETPGVLVHPRMLQQFRSSAAVLFSLLLFFQFGNEWSIAGWLPLLLIHRLGMSPGSALQMLAFYFAALTFGRIVSSYLLPRASPRKVLAVGASASLLGCAILSVTDNRLGATVSVALLGAGFAPIYPLVSAWIGRRFPYYHPGFFNGVFSLALVGGMLTPWMLGELAGWTGMWAISILPVIGTLMVVVLLIMIWVEARVTGQ